MVKKCRGEGEALGLCFSAALMGLKAIGQIEKHQDAKQFTQIGHIFKPNAANHKAYKMFYRKFKGWAEMLNERAKEKVPRRPAGS